MRPKRMHPSHARVIVACPGRRVLRSVLRPVHVNPHSTRRGQPTRGEAFVTASRLGKPTRVGGTSTGVGRADVARLAACHRFRKEEAWHVRQGRRSRPPSLRGSESPRSSGRTSCFVAEVSRRRLASNKLGKRAPKRAAGSSERGPSPRRKTAGQTVVRHRERKVRRGFGLTRVNGRAPDEDPGWRESAIQRSQHRPKGGVAVAGPGL